MAEEFVILDHYGSMEDAERAKEVLEDAGLRPLIVDEAERGNGGVYALEVPESELEEAEEMLANLEPSEEEGAVETLEEWEEESDEVRESFEEA